MTLSKSRTTVFLSPETETALAEYTRRHAGRFDTSSKAADHLLKRALTSPVDEGAEGIIAPHLRALVEQSVLTAMSQIRGELIRAVERGVRETARTETEDVVARHTKQLGNRVVAMLVNAGKDAHTAAQLARALLLYDLEDEGRVEAYYQEAQLSAGKRYAKKGAEPAQNGEGG